MRRLIWIILLLFVCMPFGYAQEELKVGVKPAAPFVIVEDSDISGFSIDLIQHLTNYMDEPVSLAFHVDSDMPSHLSSVEDGGVDVGIAATTITSEREERIDFSHPFYEASLGIITKKGEKKSILQVLMTKKVLMILLGLILYLLICGHIIWMIERKKNAEFSKHYLKGIAEGMWWTIVTMSTVGYGDVYPKKPGGRAFGCIVIISGIMLFGVAIAGLSSAMTVSQLQQAVESPDDLVGEPVGVIAGTQTVDTADEMGMRTVDISGLDEGARLIRQGDIIAMVHDTPLLQYYLMTENAQDLVLVKETFAPSSYGMAFPKDGEWREDMNIALIQSMEDGTYDTIKAKWFGIQ